VGLDLLLLELALDRAVHPESCDGRRLTLGSHEQLPGDGAGPAVADVDEEHLLLDSHGPSHSISSRGRMPPSWVVSR
jgi:hypothetical protein